MESTPAFDTRIIHPFPKPGAVSAGAQPWEWDWTDTFRPWLARDMETFARFARVRQGLQFMHNLAHVISPEKFGDPAKPETYHPEFFPVRDGETTIPAPGRVTGWQPRFSAPGIAEAAARWAIEFLQTHPNVDSYSLAVNDGLGNSEDDEEPGVVGSNGRPTASKAYYAFVNKVVALVAERFPEARCGVIAYNEVLDPPPFSLDPRVVPVLVVPTHRWMSVSQRQADQEWVEAWTARSGEFGWWDRMYEGPYCLPHLYLDTIGDTLRYLRARGATAMLAETHTKNYSWGDGPKMAVVAALLWDPQQSPRRLVHDWCRRAVGPRAGVHLAAYYRLWEGFWTDVVPTTDWFSGSSLTPSFRTAGYLKGVTDELVTRARHHLERAAAVGGTTAQERRMGVILRDFDFYEASALSYPKQAVIPAGEDEARQLFDLAADRIDRDIDMARARLVLDDYLQTGGPNWTQRRFGLDWSGWNLYTVWAIAEFVAEHDGDGVVRAHMQQRARSDASANVQTLVAMVLELADAEVRTPIVNGSFETQLADPWIVNAPLEDVDRVQISTDVAYHGTQCVKLPDGFVGGLMQTIPVQAGFFRLQAHLLVDGDSVQEPPGVGVGRGSYASLYTQFYNDNGVVVQQRRDVFSLRKAVGGWSEIAQSDMIVAAATTARVRVIVDTVGPVYVDGVSVIQTNTIHATSPWFDDVFDDVADGKRPFSWVETVPQTLSVRLDDTDPPVLCCSTDLSRASVNAIRPFEPTSQNLRLSLSIRRRELSRCSIRLEEATSSRPVLVLRMEPTGVFLYRDGDTWVNSYLRYTPGQWSAVMIELNQSLGRYDFFVDGQLAGRGSVNDQAGEPGKLSVVTTSPEAGGEACALAKVLLEPLD